tara:strand:+ start:3457 stop:4041 length:585 start_codon:yes stop_codon:yes gene_type:complete
MSTAEVSRATLVTAPTIEPITLSEAKKQCELSPTDTAHDDHLVLLIQAAREQWERDTDSVCLTQTWSVTAECFGDEFYLPKRPIQSITHLKYYDSGNTLTTLGTDVYSLNPAERSVELKYLQYWPDSVYRWDAITITYVCGYTTAALVPAIYKMAMRLLVGHYFENRDMLMSDAMQSLKAYEALVQKFLRSSYP